MSEYKQQGKKRQNTVEGFEFRVYDTCRECGVEIPSGFVLCDYHFSLSSGLLSNPESGEE